MNRVVLVGRITRDPELRTSPNGVSFVAFTIAVNRIGNNNNGEREADFINCVAFNRQADNLARFIKKGQMIGVEGKLQTRRYQATDGSNRVATEVICDMVHFLETRNGGNVQGGYNDYSSYEPRQQSSYQPQTPNQQYSQPTRQQAPAEPSDNPFDDIKNQFDITDDDLPF